MRSDDPSHGVDPRKSAGIPTHAERPAESVPQEDTRPGECVTPPTDTPPDTLAQTPDQQWQAAAWSAGPGPLGPVTVPGYVVEGELGRGGMGVVYRARQLGLNRLVALKMILHADHAGIEDRQRFQREAESLARLRHENIVQVYEAGEHEGKPFISLEYVE